MRNMRDPPQPPLVSSKSVLAAVKGQPLSASMSAEEKAPKTTDATHLSPRARQEGEPSSTLSKQPHQQSMMPGDSQVTLVGENQVEVDQHHEHLPDSRPDRANHDNGQEGETEGSQNSSRREGERLGVDEPSGLHDLVGTPKQKDKNAKSAFEITSVIDAAEGDDMDTSIRQLTTTDSDHSPVGKDPSNAGQSSEQPSNIPSSVTAPLTEYRTAASNGTAVTTALEAATSSAKPASSTRPFPLSSASSSSLLPSLGTQVGNPAGTLTGNGPQHQQQPVKRFRRVNHYMRGRWSVRDRSEPEQKPESQGPLQSSSQKSLQGSPELRGNSAPSPIPTRKGTLDSSDEGLGLSQHSHPPSISVEHGPSHSDTTSERDPHEALSRNESMSSLLTTEKSIDGEEHLQDVETEPTAAPFLTDYGTTASTPDVTYPTQLPATSTVYGVPPTLSTGVSSALSSGSIVFTTSTTHIGASSSSTALQQAVVQPFSVPPLPPATETSSSTSESNSNHGIGCFCEVCLQ